jgi:hypothetical protein
MAQLYRDALRSKMHDALLTASEDILLAVEDGALRATRDRAVVALDDLRHGLNGLLRREADEAGLHIRGLMGRAVRITQVALLLEDADRASREPGPGWLAAAAELLLKRWVLPGYDAVADPVYPDLVRQLAEA